ncbi:MAG: RND transporter, partial [Deltaproteobacteria bacterium HGW-Deltaproteobacteria-16]
MISGCIPFTFTFILLGLLTGCAVGPDFKRPATPDTQSYIATPLPAQTSSVPTPLGESQHFVAGGWVNPQWWQELGSPKLNALIDEALQASPTLAKSQAVLRQAQELYAA